MIKIVLIMLIMLVIVAIGICIICLALSRNYFDVFYPSVREVDKADKQQLIDWIFKLPDARNVDEEQIRERIYARYKEMIENEM